MASGRYTGISGQPVYLQPLLLFEIYLLKVLLIMFSLIRQIFLRITRQYVFLYCRVS